jgi:serine/threonine protein kinase
MAKKDGGRATMSVGTPTYMAPEVGGVGQKQDARATVWSLPADVFALGISFWELLSGKAFMVNTQGARQDVNALIVKEIKAGVRPGRVPASAGMTDVLWDLLSLMWDGKPEKRPQMRDVAQLLAVPRYWVPGTVADDFQRYVSYVDQQEAHVLRTNQADDAAWRSFLDTSTSAPKLAIRLAEDRDLAAKVAHAIGILSGRGGTEDVALTKKLTDDLRFGSLVRTEDVPFDD